MTIKEIEDQIKFHQQEIEKLRKAKLDVIIKNNANSNSYNINSTSDYNRCSKIADLINAFYMEKDKKNKKALFQNEISCFFKNNDGHYMNTIDAIDKLDKTEEFLNKFLGNVMNPKAKEYFIACFHAISTYDSLI